MVSEKVLLHCCNIGICVFADSAIMINRAFIRQQSEGFSVRAFQDL